MKKLYIIIILLLLPFGESRAQCIPDTLWDWEDTRVENWKAYYNQTANFIKVPWINPTGGLVGIEASKDYTREEGWMLFRREFGCPTAPYHVYPYFVLYNKYRSLLRVFVYNTSGVMVSGVTIRLSHNSGYYTGLLSNTRSLFLAADKYQDNTISDNAGDEMGMTKTEEVQQNGWLYADFPIAFDPGLSARFANLDVHADGNLFAKIDLTGNIAIGNVATGNVGINSTRSSKTDCNYCSASKFSADAAKFLERIPSYKSFKEKVGKIAEKLPEKKDSSSIFNITRRHLLHFSSNSTIQSVLDLAGGAGAAFGILSGAFSFVTGTLLGQVSAPSFSPTVMHGSVGLKGSIETNLPMMSFTTQPPGSSHSSSSQNMPYFDCPMGLLTVKNTPKVFVKRWIPFSYEKITYPGRNSQCPVFIQYPYFYSYQLQDNIEVQVNGANGDIMRLVSVEASLVARVRNQEVLGYTSNYYPSQNRSWDLFDIENFGGDTISAVCTYIDNSGTGMVFRQDTNSYALYGRNGTYYFRDVFRQGRYILEGPAVNEADAESSNYYMIRTPFRNISCLKNTSITVPEGSQLAGIKVRAIFERLDGTGKPVIYVATYRTDVQAQAETGAPYPFAPNQITRETVDLGNGMLIAQPPAQATSSLTSANYLFSGLFGSGEYEFSAGRAIELNPGFDSGSSGFEARIENYGCGQDVVSIVPSPCRFPLAPPRRKGRPLPVPAAEQPQAGVELSAFPNPVSETVQFRFSLPEASVVSLNIYNQLMQVSPVLPAARYEEGEHLLSCSMRDLPPGVYFAVFKAGEQVITKKLIRN